MSGHQSYELTQQQSNNTTTSRQFNWDEYHEEQEQMDNAPPKTFGSDFIVSAQERTSLYQLSCVLLVLGLPDAKETEISNKLRSLARGEMPAVHEPRWIWLTGSAGSTDQGSVILTKDQLDHISTAARMYTQVNTVRDILARYDRKVKGNAH